MEKLKISDILDQSDLKRTTYVFNNIDEDSYCALGAIYKSVPDSDFNKNIYKELYSIFPEFGNWISLEQIQKIETKLDLEPLTERMKRNGQDSYTLDWIILAFNDYCNLTFEENASIVRALGY
jgi:hypothetical protein